MPNHNDKPQHKPDSGTNASSYAHARWVESPAEESEAAEQVLLQGEAMANNDEASSSTSEGSGGQWRKRAKSRQSSWRVNITFSRRQSARKPTRPAALFLRHYEYRSEMVTQPAASPHGRENDQFLLTALEIVDTSEEKLC